ncbi:MAG: hypothetical protein NTZ05_00020 [Chloroflexi bacterium]|nr:hypothetical protein [Chloroflexota bacterium]
MMFLRRKGWRFAAALALAATASMPLPPTTPATAEGMRGLVLYGMEKRTERDDKGLHHLVWFDTSELPYCGDWTVSGPLPSHPDGYVSGTNNTRYQIGHRWRPDWAPVPFPADWWTITCNG